MGRIDVSFYLLKQFVEDLGRVFSTKDVSEDPRMLAAHRHLTDHTHYHAFVGGVLSDHRAKLGIDEIQKRTKRGSRWQKI